MRRTLAAGAGTFVVGLLLWLFTGDVETPIVTLTKVGAVLMVIGGWSSASAFIRPRKGASRARR